MRTPVRVGEGDSDEREGGQRRRSRPRIGAAACRQAFISPPRGRRRERDGDRQHEGGLHCQLQPAPVGEEALDSGRDLLHGGASPLGFTSRAPLRPVRDPLRSGDVLSNFAKGCRKLGPPSSRRCRSRSRSLQLSSSRCVLAWALRAARGPPHGRLGPHVALRRCRSGAPSSRTRVKGVTKLRVKCLGRDSSVNVSDSFGSDSDYAERVIVTFVTRRCTVRSDPAHRGAPSRRRMSSPRLHRLVSRRSGSPAVLGGRDVPSEAEGRRWGMATQAVARRRRTPTWSRGCSTPARTRPPTGFDAELAAAEDEGRIDPQTAKVLRWWQRESPARPRRARRTVLPPTLLALEQAQAGARPRGRGVGRSPGPRAVGDDDAGAARQPRRPATADPRPGTGRARRPGADRDAGEPRPAGRPVRAQTQAVRRGPDPRAARP